MSDCRQTRREWMLLGCIAIACIILSILQYFWTGELTRAQPAFMRAQLNGRLGSFAQAFNLEVRDNCRALTPDADEIARLGVLDASRQRYLLWNANHDKTIFTHVGVAVPQQRMVQLYLYDTQGVLRPANWPPNWESMRVNMEGRFHGNPMAPSVPPDSTIVEFPVFSGPPVQGKPRIEIAWFLDEFNQDYLRTTLIPYMASEYLSYSKGQPFDLMVSWANSSDKIFYSSHTQHTSQWSNADASIGVFPLNIDIDQSHSHHRNRNEYRMIAAMHYHAGSLETAVRRAQILNLTVSFMLVILIGGTAWLLVRHAWRVQHLSEMQFQFVAGVSHDLRTPLTAVRGAAFNMSEGLVSDPSAIRQYARLILRNAEELGAMIDNVLVFSSSQQNRLQLCFQSCKVDELLRRAIDALSVEIQQTGCVLDLEIPPGPVEIQCDPVAIELVLRNLLGNALHHAAEGKWIGVRIVQEESCISIAITDRGRGLSEEEQKKIFDPFFRGEKALYQKKSGVGLGLSLARNTVELHGGSISVANAPGDQGLQFMVRIPVIQEKA